MYHCNSPVDWFSGGLGEATPPEKCVSQTGIYFPRAGRHKHVSLQQSGGLFSGGLGEAMVPPKSNNKLKMPGQRCPGIFAIRKEMGETFEDHRDQRK